MAKFRELNIIRKPKKNTLAVILPAFSKNIEIGKIITMAHMGLHSDLKNTSKSEIGLIAFIFLFLEKIKPHRKAQNRQIDHRIIKGMFHHGRHNAFKPVKSQVARRQKNNKKRKSFKRKHKNT